SPVFVSLLQPAGGRWKITESFPIVTGIKKPLLAIQWTEGYPSTDIPTKALGYAGHYPFFKYPQVRNTTFIQNNKTGIANLFLAYMFSNTTSDTPDTASSAAGMPSTQPAA
ncbi:MAG: hypothetical protein Q8K36_04030, partial [Alphaproteobacteria bacterium]|nr:hypothetical protein [Alphaproteobacteria bacterium]